MQEKGRQDTVRTARQLGWAGLVAIPVGLLVAFAGDVAVGGVIVWLGFVTLVVMQYLAGRYGSD